MPKGKSKSAKFYQENPESRRKKAAYDKKLNARPNQRAKRSELVTKNRAADKRGVNRTNKDFDHGSNRYIDSSKNRGKTSGTLGDKKSRGGGKRKK